MSSGLHVSSFGSTCVATVAEDDELAGAGESCVRVEDFDDAAALAAATRQAPPAGRERFSDNLTSDLMLNDQSPAMAYRQRLTLAA